MIRPIKLTDALIEECVAEFRKSISASRMYSGNLEYKKTFRWQGTLPHAKISFSIPAYLKMTKLIDSFSSEIAWHCTVRRDEEHPEVFHVDDVFVSPQKVTGATVNSDQQEYEQWLCTLPDEVFNNLRMQCHSHVNMACSPSSVDRQHWSGVLNALVDEGDVFYIFMIWNKKLQYTCQVYDMTNNTYYDGEDVEVFADNMGVDLSAFLKSAQDVVKVTTYQSGYGSGSSYYSPPKTPSAPQTTQKPAVVTGSAKEEWKSGDADRAKELEKRKAEKAADDKFGTPPRYGGGYGSHGYDGGYRSYYDYGSY